MPLNLRAHNLRDHIMQTVKLQKRSLVGPFRWGPRSVLFRTEPYLDTNAAGSYRVPLKLHALDTSRVVGAHIGRVANIC